MGLTLGMASAYGATNTGSYWTQGVSEAGGWYDANKTPVEDMDDFMCYAAAAANVLAWWQNSPAGSTLTSNTPTGLENIWQELIRCNQSREDGGDPLLVVNWWVSGVYFPAGMEDSAAWERFYLTTEDVDADNRMPVTLHKENFAGYYFDQYGLDNKKLSAFLMDMQQYSKSVADIDFADLLNNGCAITLAIASETAEDGHSITLWGVEYDEEGSLTTMWLTDSDDGAERLIKVAVTEKNGKIILGEGYWAEGYYVDGVTVVNARESFKWSTRSAEAYVSWRVNPKTNNGRAGVALLADVFMNEEFAVDKLEDDEENTQEPGVENDGEGTPDLDDGDDSELDDGDDSDLDDDDDSETEGNGTLAGLKAIEQDSEGEEEEDSEEDAEEGSENDSAQGSEDSDEPETAVEAVMNALDAGKMSDRDAAAVAGASTAVLGQALSGDMERQLGAIRNRAAMDNFRHDVVALDAKGASLEQPKRFFAWVNAEGNRAEQNNEGTAAGYTLRSWGGTLGAGMQVDNQLTLGLAVTAMYGDLKSDGPDSLEGDMDTTYLSGFARYQLAGWSHSFIGSVGTMETDYTRKAMHYTNKGDTDGTAFGLMYEVSREYALSDWSNISPLLNVSYRHTVVDSYKESGTDAALNVGKQSLDTVTVALGVRYAAVVGQQMLNCACSFEARALAKYDFGDTKSNTSVGIIDTATRARIESAERGAAGLELGAGLAVPVGTGSIFADGAVELRSDYTNFNAAVGYKIQF